MALRPWLMGVGLLGGAMTGCGDDGVGALPLEAACPAGSYLEGEACLAAGLREGDCPTGFTLGDDGRCATTTSPERCPAGRMALAGESCRPVATCAEGRFGDIPTDGSTQHVDPMADPLAADGSADAPWTTLEAALQAVEAGAVIALADGTYDGAVDIDVPVTLWGRCPDTVTIEAPTDGLAIVADGAIVRGVGITGGGVFVLDATNVVLRELWLHDLSTNGITFLSLSGEDELVVIDSLIEDGVFSGIQVEGGSATVEGVQVVGTRPDEEAFVADGIVVFPDVDSGAIGHLTVVRSHVAHNAGSGVSTYGGVMRVEDTWIHDTLPADAGFGSGISGAFDPDYFAPVYVGLKRVVIERSQTVGSWVAGGVMEIEGLHIRDVTARADGFGAGLYVGAAFNFEGEPIAYVNDVSIERALVEETVEAGLFLEQAKGTVRGVHVRDVALGASGDLGDGLAVARFERDVVFSADGVILERCGRAGLSNQRAVLQLQSVLSWCNPADLYEQSDRFQRHTTIDAGSVACGCTDTGRECVSVRGRLQAPEPLVPP